MTSNTLERLAVLNIGKEYSSGFHEPVYTIDTGNIPGLDNTRIFDEKVRVYVDTIIEDAKANHEFGSTRVILRGSYTSPFRDSLEELTAEARLQQASLKHESIRLGNGNFGLYCSIGLVAGALVGLYINNSWGILLGGLVGLIEGICAYDHKEKSRLERIKKETWLAKNTEDYTRVLRVIEERE
jgi:hypothetical protein